MTTDNALVVTVDVEFFDSAFLFRGRAPKQVPEEAKIMGLEGIDFISDLLEKHDVNGTFFTLGAVAEQVPETISELGARGHELASHGYSKSHPDLRECSLETIRIELTESKRVIEEITGERIGGFRAPAFALDDTVLDVLADVGYRYDSSVMPSRRIPGFYGEPEAPQVPFSSESWFSTPDIIEFPMATSPLVRLPLSGAWMRLLGRRYTRWGVRNHMEQYPVTVLYVHPWELVEVPQYDPIPKRVGWRTGKYVRETLRELISNHSASIRTLESLHEEFTAPGSLPNQ